MASVFMLYYYPFDNEKTECLAGISLNYDALEKVAEKIEKDTSIKTFIIVEYEISDSSEEIYNFLEDNKFIGFKQQLIKHLYKYTLGEHGYFWYSVC